MHFLVIKLFFTGCDVKRRSCKRCTQWPNSEIHRKVTWIGVTLFTCCWYELKTAQKGHKAPLCSHGTGSKSCENVTWTEAIWKRFLNGARLKRNPSRCRVNTKSDTFSLPFIVPMGTSLTSKFVVIFSLLYLKSLRFKVPISWLGILHIYNIWNPVIKIEIYLVVRKCYLRELFGC